MDKYHYTECGLDNIYLVNGFEITNKKGDDEEVFIHDINGLHKTIGMILISKRGLLSGKEIKFIRTMLDLSQTTLAKILGCSYQTVLLWEKDRGLISKTADHLLRAIFFAYLDIDRGRAIYDKINEIADLDADVAEIVDANKIELEEVLHVWRLVA